jgi:two-component system chemotaxis response regulator CheY
VPIWIEEDHVLRILICDDDPSTRLLLTRMLMREPGAAVTEAVDGLQALELLEEGDFDLLILDLMMPGLDGAGVLKILREQAPLANLPVVILSGQRESETVQAVIQLGVAGFLLKPLHAEATSTRLRAIVRRLTDEVEARSTATARKA